MRASRIYLVMTLFAFLTACGRAEPGKITIENTKVQRIDDCHVRIENFNDRAEVPWVGLNYVCGVPEAVQNEKNWWGDKPQPLGFSMSVGDCLLLNETFYCVTAIDSKGATFEATYRWANRHHDKLNRLR